MASRKRRAPGASTRVPQPSAVTTGLLPQDITMSNDQTFPQPWTTDATGDIDLNTAFQDPHFFDYAGSIRPQDNQPSHGRVISLDRVPDVSAIQQTDIPAAGTLVRRNPHQQVAARRLTPWGDSFQHRESGEIHNMEDDDEELEQKALLARKDAQSKRKQIPPFVQKLSSFLDDNKNTNLIRWSDDGNSFIVLDEDEFARTLIPELFKHNNYASFVRQLNMYGFHKKVGLSDNSMKASEMKAKAPSEYYNKYFKRGRPELLWLIQKPKNAAAAKRKREDEMTKGDSDDERKYMPDIGGGAHYPEDLAIRGHADMTMIPRLEYQNLRNEVRHLQQQQKAISNVLTTIRRQNDELYQQANNFRQLHERHENSINAILTFLATFYDRSLQNGTGNLTDLFHPMQNQQPHGNVVDVDEYPEKAFEKPANQMQMQRSFRKPNLLLPAPVAKDAATRPGRAATLSPSVLSAGGSPISKPANRPVFRAPPGSNTRSNSGSTGASSRSGTQGVPNHNHTVHTKAESPVTTPVGSLPENSEIMSAIQSANANASAANSAVPGPHFDIPAALANYTAQGGMGPLTPQQRNDVLSLMASNASGASANPSNPTSSTFDIQNSNNAMVNPHPPTMPDLSHYMESRAQLEMLQKLSDEQENRVQSLQERLQPLSPSGSIPHLGSDAGGYFGAGASLGGLGEPGQYDLDLDTFVNGDDFFAAGSGADVDGGMTATADGGDPELPDLPFDLTGPDDVTVNGVDASFPNGTGSTGLAQGNQHVGVQDPEFLGVDGGGSGSGGDDSRVESLSSSVTSPAATVEDADEEGEEVRPGRPSPKRRKQV